MIYLIYFTVAFIVIYILYYLLYVRKHITYDKNKLSADIKILEGYYKVDIEKIGYQKVLRILNFTNALMMSIMVIIVFNLDKTIYKILILFVLMFPFIWVTYYFLAKYLKHLERKSE